MSTSKIDTRFKNKVLQFLGYQGHLKEESVVLHLDTIFSGIQLRVTIEPPEKFKVFTVWMRFTELPPQGAPDDMNPDSGKWNFHRFTEIGAEKAFQEFRTMVLPYINKEQTIKALSKRAKVDDHLARLLHEYEQGNFANCKPYVLSKYLEG